MNQPLTVLTAQSDRLEANRLVVFLQKGRPLRVWEDGVNRDENDRLTGLELALSDNDLPSQNLG